MRTLFRAILGIAIGGLLFWLAVRQIDPGQIGPIVGRMNWLGCLAAIGLYWLGMGVRVLRWRALLTSVKPLTLMQSGENLIVGYAVNNVLPARLGEIFRADFLCRRHGVARSAALGCVIVERLHDLAFVVLLLNIGLAGVARTAFTGPFTWLAPLASAGLFVAVVGIWMLALWHERLPLDRIPWVRDRVEHLARSVRGAQKQLPFTLMLTAIIWALESSALMALLSAFSVKADLHALALFQSASALASLLPSAPGYVGSLQAAFVLAFGAVDLPAAPAAVVATATQVFLLGSVTLVGLITLALGQARGRQPATQDAADTRSGRQA